MLCPFAAARAFVIYTPLSVRYSFPIHTFQGTRLVGSLAEYNSLIW